MESLNPFLTDEYYAWLRALVATPGKQERWAGVFRRMFEREFVWVIGNDDNRISDAHDLRSTYIRQPGYVITLTDELMRAESVNFLEVLVALSERVAFIVEQDRREWAWTLVQHIGLDTIYDPMNIQKLMFIDRVMDRVIFRTYDANGSGGFFPLKSGATDQRTVEVWYQMTAYIEENRKLFNL